MLTGARKDLFDNNNIAILKSKVAITILILNLDKKVIIVK